MDTLIAIEMHYGIQLPQGYRAWCKKRYTDYHSHESAYLWVSDAEWIPPSEFLKYETPRDRLIPGLIPFAFTAAGCPWAWSTSQVTEPNEYEILLCNRDEELADVYAPSFAAWFYRQCLEYAAEGVDNDPDEIQEARDHFRLWSKRMAELGASAWAEHLLKLSTADAVKHGDCSPRPGSPDPQESWLTSDELDELVRTEMGDRYLGTQTEWGWYNDE